MQVTDGFSFVSHWSRNDEFFQPITIAMVKLFSIKFDKTEALVIYDWPIRTETNSS